jgi:hypothetical protein
MHTAQENKENGARCLEIFTDQSAVRNSEHFSQLPWSEMQNHTSACGPIYLQRAREQMSQILVRCDEHIISASSR